MTAPRTVLQSSPLLGSVVLAPTVVPSYGRDTAVVVAPVGEPTTTLLGSRPVKFAGIAPPPSSGKNAILPRLYWKLPIQSVSLPTQSPVGVAYTAYAPAPRGLRPGFQENGTPLAGSRAATPGRGTAPGWALSEPRLLFSQR